MAKSPDGPKTVTVDGEEFETALFTSGGKSYILRELSVEEQDEIEDAARKPDGTSDVRLGMRLSLHKSIVSPPTEIDAIRKWPTKRYTLAARTFNNLNYLLDAEPGKADSPSETSAAST